MLPRRVAPHIILPAMALRSANLTDDDADPPTGSTSTDGAPISPIDLSWLPTGGGEMGRRIRAFDWASTDLGPPHLWPHSLRAAVGICMNSRFPMMIWWGPRLTFIYNDAYAPMLGKRHPE